MGELKLFIVSHLGNNPCWRLVVAEDAPSAFLKCMGTKKEVQIQSRKSCQVEEVKIEGYKIKVIKEKK
jgi:hypothetical protein